MKSGLIQPLTTTESPIKRSTNIGVKKIREYTSEYQSKNNVLLFPEHLDSDWVYGFRRWCYDMKGLRPSTIRKRMKALTRFSNWSMKSMELTLA